MQFRRETRDSRETGIDGTGREIAVFARKMPQIQPDGRGRSVGRERWAAAWPSSRRRNFNFGATVQLIAPTKKVQYGLSNVSVIRQLISTEIGKKYVNLAKQDPGRTAGTNFSQPRTIFLANLCA